MNFSKFLFYVTLSFVALQSCDSNENTFPEEAVGEHILHYDETLETSDEDFQISFDELVSDSRCPMGAICVWEGLVEIQLKIEMNGESTSMNLTLHEGHPEKAIGQFEAYTFTLLEVNPFPDGGEIDEEDYLVKFSIE